MRTVLRPGAKALGEVLGRFGTARVALIGDLCLDMYLEADMRLSELSRETPHFPLPVVSERCSPGGAGNVAANMAALEPAKLTVLGVIGNDWRGGLLRQALEDAGADSGALVVSGEVVTNTYLKTIRRGISPVCYEDPRIDFENRRPLPEEAEDRLLKALDGAEFDVLAVSDQMRFGVVTPRVRERILAIAASGKTVIVDSRDRIRLYPGCIVKPNELEALRAFGGEGEALPENRPDLPGWAARLLPAVTGSTGAPALITLGEQGCVFAEEGAAWCPACAVDGDVDIVGAGDTFLSALAVSTAAGLTLAQAVSVAVCASAVTIRKIGVTGTASREEILRAAPEGGEAV